MRSKMALLITVPFILLSMLCLTTSSLGASSEVQFLLTDSASGTYVCQKSIKAADLGLGGNWSIEKKRLRGGRQDGVDLIIVNNGRLTFTIVPTRGMSIWNVRSKETRLGWDSPTTEIVHPNFVDLTIDNGLGWLHGFGAFLPRCGLGWFGNPGPDEATGDNLVLHGLIDYIPASRVEVTVDTQLPHTIKVIGTLHEQRLFRPSLELQSVFSTEPDSLQFTVDDTIVNRGGVPAECGMLYHPDHGHPFLAEGSRIVAPFARITPQSKGGFPESTPEEIVTYREPRAGYSMQVYLTKLNGDSNGMTKLMLRNKAGDLGVSYSYSLEQLPCLTVWKNLVALEDGYVTGIEPGTAYPNHRSIERKNGHYPKLGPGQSRNFQVTFELAVGSQRVSEIESEIEAIQGYKRTVYDKDAVEGISY